MSSFNVVVWLRIPGAAALGGGGGGGDFSVEMFTYIVVW